MIYTIEIAAGEGFEPSSNWFKASDLAIRRSRKNDSPTMTGAGEYMEETVVRHTT